MGLRFPSMLRLSRVLRNARCGIQFPEAATLKHTMATLPATLKPGILNLAGTTPESQKTVERLLQTDRETHHCFFGRVGLHNHLSHQYVIVRPCSSAGYPADSLRHIAF